MDDSDGMILFCVRHGESTYNAEQRIQGQSEAPLSPLGRLQSEAVASVLARMPVDAVYSSPLLRAMETAQPIARVLGLEVRTDDRLKEIHAGIFQGHLWKDIQRLHPAEAASWFAQEADFVIPSGESRRQLMSRGQEVIQTIAAAGHGLAVVVSHGGLLAAAMKALLEIPAERSPFTLFNGSISRLARKNQWKLLTLNETWHLAQVDGRGTQAAGDLYL